MRTTSITAGGSATADSISPASGAAQQAPPNIKIDGQVTGRAVVSDEAGELYLIDANNGTIRRLRLEQ